MSYSASVSVPLMNYRKDKINFSWCFAEFATTYKWPANWNGLGTMGLDQCFSTFVRPRPGKFFFCKTRARSQQIIGLQAIFMTGHKQRYSLSQMLKRFRCLKIPRSLMNASMFKNTRFGHWHIQHRRYLGVLGLSFSTHSRILFSSEYFHYKIFIIKKCLEN
jgi:hypothetical protein